MTGEPLLDSLLFLFSVLFSAFISTGSFAVAQASRSKLEELEGDDPRAGVVLHIKEHEERLQAAVQITNTFFILLSAAIVTPYVAHGVSLFTAGLNIDWLQPFFRLITFIMTASFIASVYLVTGSLAAQSLGATFAIPISLRAAGFLEFLTRLLYFPSRVMTVLADLFLKPIGSQKAQFSETMMSEEGLMDLIEEGTKTGIIDKTEHELIESILQFTDTTAGEIMVPRKDIVAIDASMTADEILALTLQEGFTRMPVYRESLDNIIGVVYVKDVVSLVQHPNLIILADIIRPPFIVPDSKPISELLREFQRKRIHLAIVVDEFGGTEGLITLEDIIEEIVGDIRDEYDEEPPPYEILPDGSVDVVGSLNISDFNDALNMDIPESEDYDTVGGFITFLLGRLPEKGDRVSYDNVKVEVLSVQDRRIRKARFCRESIQRNEEA